MEIYLRNNSLTNYHSNSQIARVLTEEWVGANMFCPRCGNLHVKNFENNRPVADFFCPVCNSEYELKSKNGQLGYKVPDGAYDTMIDRISSNSNPDFFFMSYSKNELKVIDFIFISKYFFVPDIIEKRKPLAETARRAGWVGCNILLNKIPEQGRISIIKNGIVADVNSIVAQVRKSSNLYTNNIDNRGWLMDVLACVNKFDNREFSLEAMYKFENSLQLKHPANNNVRPKIRQQLQILRDKGFIEFLGNGKYRKVDFEG